MDLGNKLSLIRKEHNLTQEEFAERYNVTRQTISNWEKSKNYPDLDTLVKISNDFSVSLDVLLKEDKKVIKDISKWQKNGKIYKRVIILLGAILGIAIIAIGIYFGMYYSAKAKLEKNFIETIKENAFYENDEGYYTLEYSDKISYEVANQKVPIESGYKFHFFAQHIYCKIDLDEKYLKLNWIDNDHYDAEVINKEDGSIIKEIGLLGRKDINKIDEIMKKVDIDKTLLQEAVNKGNDLYNQFYN